MRVTAGIALVLLLSSSAHAVTKCPGPNTVQGIDISEWQGSINWGAVKAAGKQWAYARVSDGTYHDKTFAQNWPAMKAAGILRGAYQFFEPGEDAGVQAQILLDAMGPLGPGDLPPMLDVEVTGGQSGATIAAGIQAWINIVQSRTGRRPVIYTGTWFWDPKVGSGAFASYGLIESWYCSPGSCCPNLPSPWSDMTAWQYSSSGSVPGISGNVDLDLFNGSMADLQRLAGGVDWAAQYVNQTFPLASAPLKLTVGQEYKGYFELRNVGSKTWDGNTHIGTTQPRDRMSALAGADWLGANRPAGVNGSVAPGGSYRFEFTLKAPATPGDYKEFFGVVQEGVAWFSDGGQGGPPDDQLEIWVQVSEAQYHGQVVATSWDAQGVNVAFGDVVNAWVDVKNIGTSAWHAGNTKLAPTPRDQASVLAGGDWLSNARVSTLAADVPPGQVGRFVLPVHGNQLGSVTQTFTLLEEGVTWFADAPAGAGPGDSAISVNVNVTAEAAPDMGGPVNHGSADMGSGHSDGGAPRLQSNFGGCDVAPGGAGMGGALGLILCVGFALLMRRRLA